MSQQKKGLRTNRLLGKPASIFGIKSTQALPYSIIAIAILYLREPLKIDAIQSLVLFLCSTAGWSILTKDRPRDYFNRFLRPPKLVGGSLRYRRILKAQNESESLETSRGHFSRTRY
jgi:hypothetical protein